MPHYLVEVHETDNPIGAKCYKINQWSHKYTQELFVFSVLLLAHRCCVLVGCEMVVHTPLGLSAGLEGGHYLEAPLLLQLDV